MKIAITRLTGKEERDKIRCEQFGHECFRVSPLRAEIYYDKVREFTDASNNGEFDCIFLTSALPAKLAAPLIKPGIRVVAIGPETARAFHGKDMNIEILPRFYSSELVPYLGPWLKGKKIGILRADVPNDKLIQDILKNGGIPCEVRCYSLEPTGEELNLSGADALLFTSVMSFRHAIWKRRTGFLILAIGEVTAEAMTAGGFPPAVTGDGSLDGTLAALNQYLKERGISPLRTEHGSRKEQ